MNEKQHKTKIIAAFAAVYIIWGTTYLAIRFGVETIPPLFMAGVRFLVAGIIFYLYARLKGMGSPSPTQWKQAAIGGGLLFLGGNGALTWAEQYVSSGLAALLVASIPLWIVLFSAMYGEKATLNLRTFLGIGLGIAGIVLLVRPDTIATDGSSSLYGAIAVIGGSISWAWGTLYTKKAKLPFSPVLTSSMQMLAGGIMLMLASLIAGEHQLYSVENVSTVSVLSLLYLISFGSIGFMAYIFLLGATTPSRVATYAYVNPVVAVFVGWLFAGEVLTQTTFIAAAIIVVAVVLIVTKRSSTEKVKAIKEQLSKDRETNQSLITRMWHGVTPASKAEEYLAYLRQTGEDDCRKTEGNRGVVVMHNIQEDKAHFLFLSFWESYDAIRKFSGENIECAVYYPKDKEYLLELEPNVTHYETYGQNVCICNAAV
ncbi:MAG: drug/metabolite exporter YedA [Ignavibacteriae bacterium]|nr:drug/metabolite exporter YedA [Ignavibacteriota bacterium]